MAEVNLNSYGETKKISNSNNRTVYPTTNGWGNKKNGTDRLEKIYTT